MSKDWSEHYRHPNWQRKRLEILERDEYTCVNCGYSGSPDEETLSLSVHHKYYEYGKKPWEYPDEAYETLCEKCHEEATETDKKLRKALKLIEQSGRSIALGYMLGFALEDFKVDEVEVDSWETAKGLADAFSVPVEYVISYLMANDQRAVSFADMRKVFYWALREGQATDRLKPKSEWAEEKGEPH
jgi:hypothetical protein